MLREYRNKMLAWVSLSMMGGAVAVLLGITITQSFASKYFWFWAGYLLLAGVVLNLSLRRKTRHNHGRFVFAGFATLGFVATAFHDFSVTGTVSSQLLFVFPVLIFFLSGCRIGIALSGVMFAGLLGLAFSQGWSVFGPSGALYLLSWALVAIGSFGVEFGRRNHERRIAKASFTDPLTGLTNINGFRAHLDLAVSRKQPFILVKMDLDFFHRINLILGTQKSDELLQAVAHLLKAQTNFFDLSRTFDDEFMWIYESGADKLLQQIEELQEELMELAHKMAVPVALTASFGYSQFTEDAKDARTLWGQAELALKKAKKEGRKKACRFLRKDAEIEKNNGELISLLETAIERKDLQVHFQPKIDLEKKRITGMESLVRWTHEVRGFISPAEFVPLAEQSGMIYPLSEQVTEKSVEFLGELLRQGYSDMTVSINISPAQILRGDLSDNLQTLCVKYQVQPEKIYLEITEGLLVQEGASAAMIALRDAGFKLSLDDFGTGYSSLSYLHKFHFDELKVDKSFTDGIMRSERERKIFDTVLELSHELNYATVVEGVEKSEQVQYIQQFGISEIQGWFFASAMPDVKFLEYLRNFEFDKALSKS